MQTLRGLLGWSPATPTPTITASDVPAADTPAADRSSAAPQPGWTDTAYAMVDVVTTGVTVLLSPAEPEPFEPSSVGQVPPSPVKPDLPGVEDRDMPAFTAPRGPTIGQAPAYGQKAEGFAQKVHEYVTGLFEFAKEEYADSIDLQRLLDKGLDFVAEVLHVAHKVFPFIPDWQPPPPKSAGVDEETDEAPIPVVAPYVPLSAREGEFADKAKQVLFTRPITPGSEEDKLCGHTGRFIVALCKQTQQSMAGNRYLDSLLDDAESIRDLEQAVMEVARRAALSVDKSHFGAFKKQAIFTLSRYLAVSIPALRALTNRDGMADSEKRDALFRTLQSVGGLTSPDLTFVTNDPHREIASHFHRSLKARLHGILTEDKYSLVIGPMASVMSNLLAQTVLSTTSPEAVDGYFYAGMEFMKTKKAPSSSAPPTPSSARKQLDGEEEAFVMGMAEAAIVHLCEKKSAVVLVNWFKKWILEGINSGLGTVFTVDDRGTGLELGLVNKLFEQQIDILKGKTVSSREQERRREEVREFFHPTNPPKPELNRTWQTMEGLGRVHTGLRDLRSWLHEYPEWSANLVRLLIDKALDEFLPLQESPSSRG